MAASVARVDPIRDGLGVSVPDVDTSPPGVSAAPAGGGGAPQSPLGGSSPLRRAILLAASKWSLAAAVLSAATTALVVQSARYPACSAGEYGGALLETWVVVLTARVGVGALLRLLIWALWNPRSAAEAQAPVIVQIIRCEFLLLLG